MSWNGIFYKHRDYEHDTVFEHLMAAGGTFGITEVVYCDVNPVTQVPLTQPRVYYAVAINSDHFSREYSYLIPAESDYSEPERRTIGKTVQQYIENPVEGGRSREDYEADEEELSDSQKKRLAGLRERLEALQNA